MQTFLGLVVSVLWTLGLYRLFSWRRRITATHRARLLQAGYLELNQNRRLRGNRYTRIGMIVYAVFYVIAYQSIAAAMPPRAMILAVVLVAWVGASVLALAPGVFGMAVALLLGELNHPQGDFALRLRDAQFMAPSTEPKSSGQHGSSELLDAGRAGAVDWTAIFIPKRRPVTEGVK